MKKNLYAAAFLIVAFGIAFYFWQMKIHAFEIDYTKVTFDGNDSKGEPQEKSITDCIANSLKESQQAGKTRSDETHYNFFCRCVKYNTKANSNIKQDISVRNSCWDWSEKFFDKPGLFDK
jgi:hypothetical protein